MVYPRLLPHQFVTFNIFICDALQVIDDFVIALRREEVAVAGLQFEVFLNTDFLANLARCDDFAVDCFKDGEQSTLGSKTCDLYSVTGCRSPTKWAWH